MHLPPHTHTHTSEYADMTSYFSVQSLCKERGQVELVCLSANTTLQEPTQAEEPAEQTVHACVRVCLCVLVRPLELESISFPISAFISSSLPPAPRLCFLRLLLFSLFICRSYSSFFFVFFSLAFALADMPCEHRLILPPLCSLRRRKW